MKGRSSPDQALRRAGAMGLRPFCHGAGQRGRRQASSIRHQAWAGGCTLLHQPLMFGGLAAGPVGGRCRTGVIILPPWGRSSAGRARRSQCRGREFDPPRLHHPHSTPDPSKGWAFLLAGWWPDDADGAGREFHLGQLFGISEWLASSWVGGMLRHAGMAWCILTVRPRVLEIDP